MTDPLILILTTLVFILAVALFFSRRKINQSKIEIRKISKTISEELKNKVEEVNEEKNRLFAILRSMAEGVLVIDTDERILLINAVLADRLKVDKDEVKSRFFWEIIRDPEINEMIRAALKSKVMLRKEHTLLLSDSVFQIQVAPVFGESDFLGIVAVFHDVTKLKELERMRTEFVANVSHELKTPLTSIMGFVETLKEGAIEDPANRMKFLEIIDDQSAKLHRLIEDLLILSRIESGKDELKIESLDLEGMLSKAFKVFEKTLKSKNINITFEMNPKPFFINADAKLFEQVLTNILDNAIKYNKEGGQIIVRARKDRESIYIECKDTGIGIPEDHLPRIFERFYRVDKSRARESGGTGLGLSIVKHILERHSGRITASSSPSEGSIFTVTLPK